MRKEREYGLTIAIVLLNLLLLLKLIIESFQITNVNYMFLIILVLLSIIIFLIYKKYLYNKKRKFICFLFVIFIGGYIIYKNQNWIIEELNFLWVNIKAINQAALYERKTNYSQFTHLFIIIIPIITWLMFVVNIKFKNFILLFNGLVFLLFWYLILNKYVLNNLNWFIYVCIITIILNQYVSNSNEVKARELKSSINIKHIIISSVVISVIITNIIKILPQEAKGNTVEGIITQFENRFAKKDSGNGDALLAAEQGSYNLTYSGYSDSTKRLGGRIKLDKKEVFKVKSDASYYLKGTVRDYYNGICWTSTQSTKELKKKSEDYNFYTSNLRNDKEGIDDRYFKIKKKSLTIYPSNTLQATSFFTPNNTININSGYENIYYTDIPTFSSNNYVKETYIVDYYSYSNYNNKSYAPYFEGIENGEKIKIPEEEDYILPMDIKNADTKLSNSRLEKVLNKYEKYLQISSVDEKVFELVESIINEEKENKGRELSNHDKALAIRNYLTDNYPYTLDVSDVPEGKDFVTYFLFSEKKGYCTYFASATTMMCRIAGIPTRYVEGFKMSDKQDETGKYVVTNGEAHAWSEILINPDRDQWIVVDPSPTPTELEEQQKKEEINKPDVNENNLDSNINTPNRNNKPTMEEEVNFVEKRKVNKFVLVIITVLLILGIIKSINIMRINKVINSKGTTSLYLYYLQRLKTIGIIKPTGSGDLEFGHSINENELKKRMLVLVNSYYEEFYGGVESSNLDKREYIKFIERYIKNRDKWYKYILNKYLIVK